MNHGDFAAARTLYEESLAIYREIGNRQGVAISLGNLGDISERQKEYAWAEGRALSLEQAIALALEKPGDR